MKWLKACRAERLIFFCFLLLSLILTYPLFLRIKSHVYGSSGDPLGLVWYIWWLKYSGLNLDSSSFCPFLAAPFGVTFAHYSIYITSTLLQQTLASLVNEVFAYNLLIFFTFPLAAITMYYLVFYFTKNKIASMFSGIVYAFSPCHFAQSLQHFGLAQIQWMPLYLLALFKLEEKRSYKYAFLAALALSLVTFTDYYHLYFMLITTVVFVLWGMWQGLRNRRLFGYPVIPEGKPPRRTTKAKPQRTSLGGKPTGQASLRARSASNGAGRLSGEQKPLSRISTKSVLAGADRQDQGSKMHFFRVILVAILLFSFFVLPFTHSFIREVFFVPASLTRATFVRPLQDLFSNAARPLSYLLPSQGSLVFGSYTKKFIGSHFYGWSGTEHALYLGYSVLILSFLALREWRRKNRRQVRKWESGQVSRRQRLSGYQVIRSSGEGKNRSPITDYRSQKAVSFFFFAAIVALLFSHAPYGNLGNFRIFFPSYFMYKFLPMVRVYARFGILVMLCLSVLAGFGLKSLLAGKTRTRKRALLSLMILLLFIEFMPSLPAPTFDATVLPPEYKWLSEQPGDFIIVEYPLETEQEYLFYQRIHQKRLVNGAPPGTYADQVKKEIINIANPKTPGILAYLGVKYVLLHPDKYLMSEDVEIIGELPNLEKRAGLRALKVPGTAQLFEVTAQPIRPASLKNERN